eukprot:9984591-Prorocentrum_lima.AAC.1
MSERCCGMYVARRRGVDRFEAFSRTNGGGRREGDGACMLAALTWVVGHALETHDRNVEAGMNGVGGYEHL